ncbi:MAG: carbamoyl-phosphate synthase subunit L [Spirochaetia bacterium]|nr:carbamoyl-phosphate synthase subunit L [Spirochaetia bacterium]
MSNAENKDIIQSINESLLYLKQINPRHEQKLSPIDKRPHRLQKVMVANRGEIAKRFFLTLKEEGIPSVAIVTDVDLGQSWYEMADEVVVIGNMRNYTNISIVIAAAQLVDANGIYPGYGFLSENPAFVEAIDAASAHSGKEIIFMGPAADIMHRVGDKLAARKLAKEEGVPLFEGSPSLPDAESAKEAAKKIGYPVIVKLSAGGGGKGMMPVFQESGLYLAVDYCQRTGRNLYSNDTFYLEKYIERPVHMEVQIFNDTAIGLRKCAVQRRNQKVIEENGNAFLDSHTILSMLAAAENMARISGYSKGAGAGTVEFLFDPESQRFGFLEMNVRLQVEHPVTDQAVGIDLAKWQVLYFDGRDHEIPYHTALEGRFKPRRHTIEARIYAEDPENDYAPAPGKVQELELPTFNGLRCDFGFKKGDVILPHYDPMIGKIIVESSTRRGALLRLERSLSELYVRGVVTNINQLLKVVRHEEFRSGKYTNRILIDNKDLETGDPATERESQLAAIFGSLAENARLVQESVSNVFMSRDLENTIQAMHLQRLPIGFQVKIYSKSYKIQLMQTSLDLFYVFVDNHFMGEVELLPRMEGNEDYLIRFGMHYYPIRIDKKPVYSIIRMPDNVGKIHYYKMTITALGAGAKADPAGMVRAPFQSTFVAFSKDEHLKRERLTEGSIVKKGDPIVIISAMKMETTLNSPLDGKITYLCEDGDLSRLEIGRTPDGLVIGKSLLEGEVLFIVEDTSGIEASKEEDQLQSKSAVEKSDHILDWLNDEEIYSKIKNDPQRHIPVLLRLIKAHFNGFLPDDKIINRVSEIIKSLDAKVIKKCDTEQVQNEIVSIINFYTGIKRLYSPLLDTNLSYFGELNQLVRMWEDDRYRPSYRFRMTLSQLFKVYGIIDWMPRSGADNSKIKLAFFNLLRAEAACIEYSHVIRQVVEIIANTEKPSKKITTSLKGLILQEQGERDDSLATYVSRLLRNLDIPQINRDVIPIVSRKYIPEYRIQIEDVFSSFNGHSRDEVISSVEQSIKKPYDDLIEDSMSEWMKKEINASLDKLKKNFKIKRLYSMFQNIVIYQVSELKNEKIKKYLAIAFVDNIEFLRDDRNQIITSESTEVACIQATQLIRAYQAKQSLKDNWIEIYACKEPVLMDLRGINSEILNYQVFARSGMSVLRFFTDISVDRTTIFIDARHPVDQSISRKVLFLARNQGRLTFDLLIERDSRNPYYDGNGNDKDQRLFDRDKWPIDIWANETFDPGSIDTITINSIDNYLWKDPKSAKEIVKPVGGKIYSGTVGSKNALFYMKDSRIAGGASGDLEGLKYVAAAYIAYHKNMPLYVWNDGAGANIKEGMISLNRAAEGFMINALLGGRVDKATFSNYTKQFPDESLRNLFAELDKMLSSDLKKLNEGTGFFIVGVGIGSSTGLDVYGSSQMAIQVMVDAEQSYRVLTGSNVIKSVTGEDLTNYEIGGAKVMSKWTGTVDLIAENKLHLMTYIRSIQEIFVDQASLPSIQRIKIKEDTEESSATKLDVLNYQLILRNVDGGLFLPMKEEYYGSGSAIGGFARIGGRAVLIMGPRTNFGIRSFATVTKVKELLSVARKTGVNQIILFGKNWYHETITEDDLTLRARTDFMKMLSQKSGVRIHIITHKYGLHKVVMNHSVDALIFVQKGELSQNDYEVVRKTAAFIVDSVDEAFDMAHKIIELLDPIQNKDKNSAKKIEIKVSSKKVTLPSDTSVPFDMKANVIEPLFDEGSFIEFYEKMNDKTQGPSLITGFARLNGQTVGVIADQPLIMGGAPDAPGTEKFRVFTELVSRNNIPLVMLSNAPGFVPGTKQERLRIQQIGGESLDVNVLSNMPVVSVVLNQNYGGRQIHSFSRFLRPGIVYLALKRSVLAVMGANASFDLFEGSKYQELLAAKKTDEANKLKKKYVADYNTKAAAENDAFTTGVLDWLIENENDLRKEVIKGLEKAKEDVKRIFMSK